MDMHTEALILGSGIAACLAALAVVREGVKVTLVAPEWESSFAELGSSGVCYRGERDSKELQCEDLKRLGGESICPRALEYLTAEGAACVEKWLVNELQFHFDRDESGRWILHQEEGHSIPRTLKAGERTAEHVLYSLKQKLQQTPNLKIITDHVPIELITLSAHSCQLADIYKKPTCLGAYLLDQKSGEIVAILAKETVIATSGIQDLFQGQASYSAADGRGLALAARAGVRLIRLHQMQQHSQGASNIQFSCNGGIAVDKAGQTSLMRLRAIGESACTGVHGNYRQASLNLLEALVWANSTAQDLVKQMQKFVYYFPEIKPLEQGAQPISESLLKQEWNTLRHVMSHYAFPKASKEFLRRARTILTQQASDLEPLYNQSILTAPAISLRHASEAARLIVEAAMANAK